MPDMKTLKIGNKTYYIRDSRIGDLADLNTTDKDSVVEAINETLTRTGPTDQQVQDAVDDYLDNHPTITGTFTNEAKNALIYLLAKVAYVDDDGQDLLDALTTELFAVRVTSLSAVYTQSGGVYIDDTLDVLKPDLVVTADYSDGTTGTVASTAYILSGDISTTGTQTITVTYGGKTTTFTVTVSAPLYTIPDFAEKTITISGKTAKIKKVNGVYTFFGALAGAYYLYPANLTWSDTKSSTLWFSTAEGTPVRAQIIDANWNNPGSATHQFDVKFAQVESGTNNTLITSLNLTPGTGSAALTEYVNAEFGARNISCIGFQIRDTRSYVVSVSFKYRLFVNGVRYL